MTSMTLGICFGLDLLLLQLLVYPNHKQGQKSGLVGFEALVSLDEERAKCKRRLRKIRRVQTERATEGFGDFWFTPAFPAGKSTWTYLNNLRPMHFENK